MKQFTPMDCFQIARLSRDGVSSFPEANAAHKTRLPNRSPLSTPHFKTIDNFSIATDIIGLLKASSCRGIFFVYGSGGRASSQMHHHW
jgi:hypothetical protein